MFNRYPLAAALGLALTATLAGCSVTPEDKQRHDELDPMTDIFGNEKHDPNEQGLFSSVFGSSKEDQKRQQENEQRLAELERKLQEKELASQNTQPAAPVNALAAYQGSRTKLATVVTGAIDPTLQRRLQQAIDASSNRHPITTASPQQLADQLAQPACSEPASVECAERLAIYPGVRLVAVITPRVEGSQLSGTLTMLDAAYGIAYKPSQFRIPALNGAVTEAALQGLADQIAYTAVDRAGIAPWTTRAFASSDGEWHIAAGGRSGLSVGDRLTIRGPGKLVRSPTGAPAGWAPGSVKGVLEVTSLFGTDFATAKLVEGQPPSPQDPLLKSER